MKNADKSAYPITVQVPDGRLTTDSQTGLTKREYFASNEEIPYDFVVHSLSKKIGTDIQHLTMKQILEHRSELKCQFADALLKQLSNP